MEPARLQKERKAREQLAEKHIRRSWKKELEGFQIYCQRQEKMEGTHCRLLVVMGRDFVSALQPVGLLNYLRINANVAE
jgi:hypothetical protein